jgi:hypothetical protein
MFTDNFCFFPRIDPEFAVLSWRSIMNRVPGHLGIRRRAPGNSYLRGVGNCGKEKNGGKGDKTKSQRAKRNPTDEPFAKDKMRNAFFWPDSVREAQILLPFLSVKPAAKARNQGSLSGRPRLSLTHDFARVKNPRKSEPWPSRWSSPWPLQTHAVRHQRGDLW